MEPSKHLCQSCHCLLDEGDRFCSVCGQKRILKTTSIREFFGEFLSNSFSLDSKLFRTFGTLFFIPGKLTTEYFAGKRQLYYTPIRLFLFWLTIAFIILSLTKNNQKKEAKSFNKQVELEIYKDSLRKELNLVFPDSASQKKIAQTLYSKNLFEEIDSSLLVLDSTNLSIKDFFLLSPDEIIKKSKLESFWQQKLLRKLVHTVQELDNFKLYLLSHLSWIILISIPFLGLLLKLLYIRQKRNLIEHIIHTLHLYTFFSGLAAVFFAGLWAYKNNYIPIPLSPFLILLLPIYIFVSMKRVYGQSSLKTLFKLALFMVGYSFIMTFSVAPYLLLVFFIF